MFERNRSKLHRIVLSVSRYSSSIERRITSNRSTTAQIRKRRKKENNAQQGLDGADRTSHRLVGVVELLRDPFYMSLLFQETSVFFESIITNSFQIMDDRLPCVRL